MAGVQSRVDQRLLGAVETAVHRSQRYLLSVQYADGYWCGELESNPTMEAEYLMLTYLLEEADLDRWGKLANYILSRQREDGSWGSTTGLRET